MFAWHMTKSVTGAIRYLGYPGYLIASHASSLTFIMTSEFQRGKGLIRPVGVLGSEVSFLGDVLGRELDRVS